MKICWKCIDQIAWEAIGWIPVYECIDFSSWRRCSTGIWWNQTVMMNTRHISRVQFVASWAFNHGILGNPPSSSKGHLLCHYRNKTTHQLSFQHNESLLNRWHIHTDHRHLADISSGNKKRNALANRIRVCIGKLSSLHERRSREKVIFWPVTTLPLHHAELSQ